MPPTHPARHLLSLIQLYSEHPQMPQTWSIMCDNESGNGQLSCLEARPLLGRLLLQDGHIEDLLIKIREIIARHLRTDHAMLADL